MYQAIWAQAKATYAPLVDLELLFEKLGQIGEGPESVLMNVSNSGKVDGVRPTGVGLRMIAAAVWQGRHERGARFI
jgi:hypothetical protein